LNETKPFRIIEPFDRTRCHFNDSFFHG
jgi:hypothetical protein